MSLPTPPRLRALGVAVALALTGLPGSAAAQEPPPDQGPPPPPPEELEVRREVFTYPAFQRRNPFRPLTTGDEGGPRFEQLRLMGVIYFADDPAASVAILGTSQVQINEDGTSVTVTPDGRGWYLSIGQAIGNVRVVEIQRDQIVVEVEEFGLTERRVMQVENRRLGGNR